MAKGDHDNKLTLVFIVNGVDVTVEANVNAQLAAARNKALELSSNTGRAPDEWEIHNEAGQLLDASLKVLDLGLADGARLFLNLRVGAGGGE